MATDAEILTDIQTAIANIASRGGITRLTINGRSSEYDLAGLQALLKYYESKNAIDGGAVPLQQHRIQKGGSY